MPTFTVMTWNVENFFRPAAGAPAAEQDRYERKVVFLAQVIRQLAPDVLGLQEVGGEDALADVQAALTGSYPHRAVSMAPDARGIRVAFLSRLAIEARADIVDFPGGPATTIQRLTANGGSEPITRMGRGALSIRVTTGGQGVTVITAHLKSKLLSFPRPGGTSSFIPRDETERAQVAGVALLQRAAEAVTLRLHANAHLAANGHTPLVLLGDFNDVPEAQTSLLLTGPSGSEIGTAGFYRPDKGDRFRLFNLAPCIAAERRFSRVEQGRKELLDQVLASVAFFPIGQDNQRRLPVVDSHIHFESRLPSVSTNPGDRASAIAPDHAPVTATFEL